ncbi:MAG TPA: hypothetical protein VFQ07_06840, partial [Candidatus Polarisedimenticolia bacterium]|nr:hypothetical protein [Candidatus Polarisedimenticolia bacterium]
CDASPAVVLTEIGANEPAGGDIAGADLGASDFSLDLRATRAAAGPGRVYRITYQALDTAGNTVERVVEVTVPHDRRGGVSSAPLTVKPEPVHGGAVPAPGKGH